MLQASMRLAWLQPPSVPPFPIGLISAGAQSRGHNGRPEELLHLGSCVRKDWPVQTFQGLRGLSRGRGGCWVAAVQRQGDGVSASEHGCVGGGF